MAPRVSVVLPTYKRPDLLARCLRCLLDQDMDSEAYEIIVVDDAANLETKLQVEGIAQQKLAYWAPVASRKQTTGQYEPSTGNRGPEGLFDPETGIKNPPRIRYIPVVGNHGPAAARNRGWEAAEGDIIAFIDDDCVPSSGWLRSGLKAFEDLGVEGVSGQVIVPTSEEPTDYELNLSNLEKSDFVTANCFYRKDALQELGGFDERFTMAWREDSDLYFSLLEREAKLATAPDAIVFHPVRQAPWGISIREQRKSMFNALLFKKHPFHYRERMNMRLPGHYYLNVAGLLAAMLGGMVQHTLLAATGLTLWFGLSLYFSGLRLERTSHRLRHVADMTVTSALIPTLAVFWRLVGALKYRVFFI
jgi:glycosyltransferase involved in cell wall biosynthesis